MEIANSLLNPVCCTAPSILHRGDIVNTLRYYYSKRGVSSQTL
jgi:hypothetical protein